MARVLLTGTPERIAPVAERLVADGFAVRCAVPGGAPVCDGAESIDATPDLPGGIVMALQGVAVVAWLLGDESWSDRDLHGEKLETMLLRVVDTGVRGFIYEQPHGFVGADSLAQSGVAQVAHAHDTWHIPVATVNAADQPLDQAVSTSIKTLLEI